MGVYQFLILAIVVMTTGSGCSFQNPSDSKILSQVYSESESKNPKVLKRVSVDESTLVVITQNSNSETISQFQKTKDSWEIRFKESFFLTNFGSYAYDPQKKTWVPVEMATNSEEPFLFRNLLMEKLPGDAHPTIFTEVLTELPGRGLVSAPFAFRNGKKILDGLALFGDGDVYTSVKRIPISFQKENKSLIIFSDIAAYRTEMVWNGWELLADTPGNCIPSLVSHSFEKNSAKPGFWNLKMEWKNRGQTANTTYLSFSFPDSKTVKILRPEESGKSYAVGASIFFKSRRHHDKSQYPLVEITKSGWGRNYKMLMELEIESDSPQTPKVLVRFTNRFRNEILEIPNNFTQVVLETDQQGYKNYILESSTK